MPNLSTYNPEAEGAFASPIEQVAGALCRLLSLKYATDIAYRSFADRVRGPWRDALVTHWQDHAKEEREATYDIAMKIMGMGVDPMILNVSVQAASGSVEAFCQALLDAELALVKEARSICNLSGDNTALRVLMENIIVQDTQHIDDLRRMCSEMC